MANPVDSFIRVAIIEIGTVEVPRGSNKGPRVEQYLRTTGLGGGYAWCAAFVAFCGVQAMDGSEAWPLPRTADCDVLLAHAKKRGILFTSPKPGDVFLVRASESDANHTGIVTAVNGDGTIATIEGNTNRDGGREGYAVLANPRRVIAKAGRLPLLFIRWTALLSPPEAPWTVKITGEAKPYGTYPFVQQGVSYLPARELLERMKVATSFLGYDKEDNSLTWHGATVNAPVLLRGGVAWAGVRDLSEWFKAAVGVDVDKRIITLTPPKMVGVEA